MYFILIEGFFSLLGDLIVFISKFLNSFYDRRGINDFFLLMLDKYNKKLLR